MTPLIKKLTLTTAALLLGALSLTATSNEAQALGLLIPKDTAVRPFDVESHRVDVTITNTAAVTKIEQVFRNHTDRPMEATFVFPIPEGATVSDFSLWINGTKTAGAVLEKEEARRIYESIVRRVEDPGLIEYMDGKLFKASIFPIPARGTQKLEIKFGQVLGKQGGMYRYTYPLSVGKDYAVAKAAKDFTLTARVHSPLPITTVYSPTHKISTHRKSSQEIVLGMEEMYATLDQDFELFLGLSKADIGLNIMTHDPDGDGGEPGYFMMALAPRVDVAAHDEVGQTFTFVMDTSGSMAGPKIEQARKTLEFCLGRLRPQDHFNIIRFSTDVESLHDNPVAATDEAKRKAIAFARELMPAGGTAISPALEQVFKQRTPKHQPHQVIFVTDGIPTVGETDPNAILKMVQAQHGAAAKKARIFTFGVGYDVNTNLLDGIATQARGRADYVKPEENMENAVAALYTRISAPVLSDIKIDFGDARVYDLYPTPIPDLFRGDQVVLFGRYRQAFNTPIKVSGRAGNELKEYKFGGDTPKAQGKTQRATPNEQFLEPLEFLPKLWATRKVGYLLEQIRLNGEQAELKGEVINLAKKFGLVTPYTSYLAVDDSEFANNQPSPRPRPEPRRTFRPTDDRIDGLRGGNLDEDASPEEEAEVMGRTGDTRRPARPASAPKTKADKKADSFKGFGTESGQAAVDASIATRDYKEKQRVDNDQGVSRQYISGRTFVYKSNQWIEDGLDANAKNIIKVEAYSSKYFELARKHKELSRAAKLGHRLLIKLDGRIYQITPPKTK